MDKRTFIKNAALISGGLIAAPKILFSKQNNSYSIIQENGKFKLPPLPYNYNIFPDVIDEETMMIHYSKHHQGYVNKLNKALKNSSYKFDDLSELLSSDNLPDSIRNNGGGHYNHSLYWNILKPGGSMSVSFSKMIMDAFGSTEALLNELAEKGKGRFGSGWVWLCQSNDGKLFVTSTANQDNPLMHNIKEKGNPLLGIDVWEHAYYLKYQNKRGDYLKNILSIINWSEVENRMF